MAKQNHQTQKQKDDALFEALGRSKKRKKRKILITVISIVLILAIVLVAGVNILKKQVQDQFGSAGAEVLSYTVSTGTISTVVSGSGTLADAGNSATWQQLVHQRQEYEALMQQLMTLYTTEILTAPCDGVISGIDSDSTQLLANSTTEIPDDSDSDSGNTGNNNGGHSKFTVELQLPRAQQMLSGLEDGATYYYAYNDTLFISNIPSMGGGSFFGR